MTANFFIGVAEVVAPELKFLLGGLLILWAVILFGGFAIGKPDAQKLGRANTVSRIGSSAVLVLAAWLWYTVSPSESSLLLLALGMTFGFIGDLFMAKLIIQNKPELGGMAAFGLGHIFYILAFFGFADKLKLNSSGAFLVGWGIWLLIGVAGWYFVVFRGRQATVLHWAALPYGLLLSSTAGVATSLALQQISFGLTALGAALFLVSDLIIATQLFNKVHFPLIRDVIWLTYGPAQALIVYSAYFVIL